MNTVLLSDPIIITGFVIALSIDIFGLIKKCGVVFAALGYLVFVSTCAYALIAGASLYEVGAVATVFFIVNLLPLWKKGGGK